MSERKHTPWTLDINPHWDRGGVHGDAVFARIMDGPFTVFALTTETQMDRQETLDAALLCVAAPDLLEALQYVLSAHGEQLTDAFDQAHKAIAKAEGRDE